MNIGLITSYLIGGILLLSILAMNMSLSRSSNELTLTQMTGQHTRTIAEILTYDIPKIGYDLTEKINNPILSADSNKIVFESNINNTGGIERVIWTYTNSQVNSTDNPHDFKLIRTVKTKDTTTVISKTEITIGVTHFKINYYDEYGTDKSNKMSVPVSVSDLDKIKQIEIQLAVESAQKLSGLWSTDGRYVRSVWEKRFSPGNLEDTN